MVCAEAPSCPKFCDHVDFPYESLAAPSGRTDEEEDDVLLEAQLSQLRKVAEAAKRFVEAEKKATTTPTYFFQPIKEAQEALADLRRAVEAEDGKA